MGDEQRRIYKALKEDMIAVLSHSDMPETAALILQQYGIAPLTIDDLTVTSMLATTLMMRLQQISSGFVKTETGREISIPSIKHEVMAEMLPELTDSWDDHKCVVFARFTHDVESLLELCESLNIGAVRLDGKTSKDAADVVRQLQTDPGVRVLVGNIQVSATGFTMTAADNAVFFSHSHRYDHRHQALKRIHRMGQTRPVTYRDLIASSADETILRSLGEKQDMAVNTLDDLRNLIASL
jgi:SNF2 family DNA or RNA helicase